jgi:hypothetical protein
VHSEGGLEIPGLVDNGGLTTLAVTRRQG